MTRLALILTISLLLLAACGGGQGDILTDPTLTAAAATRCPNGACPPPATPAPVRFAPEAVASMAAALPGILPINASYVPNTGGAIAPPVPPPPTSPPPTATNGYGPTDDIEAYLSHLKPSPGDVLTLNLHYLAWNHGKDNDAAWRFVFSDRGRLYKAGWRFEIVNKSGCCYQVRIAACPMTERDREIAELKQQQRELAARLAALERS